MKSVTGRDSTGLSARTGRSKKMYSLKSKEGRLITWMRGTLRY